VAVEADWPDAYRVNRYVMGLSHDEGADAALSDFRRFPAWMWRNRDIEAFVQWLRARNEAHVDPATKVRFYGLDLYSLRASMEAVVDYLDHVDPVEAGRARERYSCFDQVGGEGQAYGGSCATPRSTTSRCTGPRCRHGIFGIGTWRERSMPLSISTVKFPERRSSYGSTIHTWATHAPPRWVHVVS
jgi:erythromycin esterase-like protein